MPIIKKKKLTETSKTPFVKYSQFRHLLFAVLSLFFSILEKNRKIQYDGKERFG